MDLQRRRVAAVILACALVFGIGLYLRHHHAVAAVHTGDRIPTMAFSDLRGAPVTLQPQRGVTVYNVFTSWCPSCKEETPALARAADGLRERGIRIIGIDQGESPGAVASFVGRYGVPYPILVDTSRVTNAVLGARIIPETVVVRDGIVKAIAVGPITPEQLEQMIGTV